MPKFWGKDRQNWFTRNVDYSILYSNQWPDDVEPFSLLMYIKINRAPRHTVGPTSNEVPESAIAAQRDVHNPNT